MQPITVNIWSDIACPWCYLGKRRFENALRDFDGEVTVSYHSFELSPDMPADFDGGPVDFLADRRGMPRAQVEQMFAQMTALGESEGLRYDFDSLRPTRTMPAHQALHHAKAHGRQAELVERLFAAHFVEGRHIGHVDELVALGVEVGLDGDELRAALTDGRYAPAVAQDIRAAQRLGVTGVPFFVIDERYGVSGAQSSETLLEALRRAAADRTGGEAAEQS